jgi:hypothetical protein
VARRNRQTVIVFKTGRDVYAIVENMIMTLDPRGEPISSVDVYWRDVFLGTATQCFGDSFWITATFVAGHGFDQRFVELMDCLFDESLPPKDPPPHLEHFFEGEDDDWMLVGPNKQRWPIFIPAINVAESSISWKYSGEEYPNLMFLDT